MTSTMRLGTLVLACGAFAAVGCRMDMPGSDVVTHDATPGNDVQHTDVLPGMDVPTNVDVPVGGDVQPMGDGAMHMSVTIQQVQNVMSAGHPAPGSVITLSQTGLVALTPRLLIGSANGNSAGDCRFGVWVGDGTQGPYTGVLVEELVHKGDAGSCFNAPAFHIPATVQAGDAITLIDGATYEEFCAGPTGTAAAACANWDQSEIFGPRTFTVGAHGAAPTPSPVTVSAIGVAADGTPQPATLTYEGVLVHLTGVQLTAATTAGVDGGTSFSTYTIHDTGDTTHSLQIDVVDFPHTNCVRSYLTTQNGMTLSSVTGVLIPDFGVWKVRVRDENDIGGIGSCAPIDGGVVDGG